MTFIQKATREQVIEAYKKHKTYLWAGKSLGISRQRVEQIIRTSRDPEIMLIRISNKKHKPGKSCLMCSRKFDAKVRHTAKGYCRACYPFALGGRVPQKIRRAMYPANCILCKDSIVNRKKARGMCIRCYNREVTSKIPNRIVKVREYNAKSKAKKRDTGVLSTLRNIFRT